MRKTCQVMRIFFPGVITEDETADKDENKPTEVDSEKLSKEDQ